MASEKSQLSLSQAEIEFLVGDGALDDRNIPEDKSSPVKASVVPPENIKVSPKILKNRGKFFGSGTSEEEVVNILSQDAGDFKLPSSSPPKSPKKKKVSPIKVTRNHPIKSFTRNSSKSPSPKRSSNAQTQQTSPNGSPTSPGGYYSSPSKSPSSSPSAKKRLPFSQSPTKQGDDLGKVEGLSGAEGKYYFESFYYIIECVRTDKRANILFTKQELGILNSFQRQQSHLHLYVRLMNRIDSWKACSAISYKEIAADLEPLFSKLEEEGYITCDISKEPLEVVLNLLKMESLKDLCKTFKQKVSGTKEEKVNCLCQFARTQPTMFNIVNPVRKHAVKELGRCFRLTPAPRLLFRRCALIFSMFHSSDELDKLFQTQSLLLLEVSRQNMVFPLSVMDLYKDYHIYDNREQFLRYEKARDLRQQIFNAKDVVKDLDRVESITKEVLREFQDLLGLGDEQSASVLPPFLRRFRAGSVYARMLESGAEALRTGKNVELAKEAVLAIQNQSVYLPQHAGRWAVLLATILQVNCKDNIAAAEELCRGLGLTQITTVDRIALNSRAQLILKRKKGGLMEPLAGKLRSLLDPPVEDPDAVEFQARSTNITNPGFKRVYVSHENGGRTYRSVEEEVLLSYRNRGFYGRHDEGALIKSLCLLSMWDIIYDTTHPSVFLSQFQDKPLDWGSREFYESRRDQIEGRLEFLRMAGEKSVTEELLSLIDKHRGTVSLVVWESLENIVIEDLLECLKMDVFIAVCRRLLQDYRSHRSGLPDLTLWNNEEKKCLFVEVKGPNDTLSLTQTLWLDYLKKHGTEAIVANVRATGSKEAKK